MDLTLEGVKKIVEAKSSAVVGNRCLYVDKDQAEKAILECLRQSSKRGDIAKEIQTIRKEEEGTPADRYPVFYLPATLTSGSVHIGCGGPGDAVIPLQMTSPSTIGDLDKISLDQDAFPDLPLTRDAAHTRINDHDRLSVEVFLDTGDDKVDEMDLPDWERLKEKFVAFDSHIVLGAALLGKRLEADPQPENFTQKLLFGGGSLSSHFLPEEAPTFTSS